MDTEQLQLDLEGITGQRAIDAGETMVLVLARLDRVANASDTPIKLKHYLSQRSYVKALAWLADPTIPHQL
ncbi:hypothetical protein SH580_02485 [Coraliomargarita algicola]|uniref:Uncharacterized protein n=1 Tax=Coraliomargarita algicola TaxID=3092156 RepID=A0ABZ0RK43_9BACT|nr:hypothetical protein [Coraliomargarita sp. J2-16]WPJ96569.1 hypothetical protein SH580_02485 [Coraliomargarita sp. J2-16]